MFQVPANQAVTVGRREVSNGGGASTAPAAPRREDQYLSPGSAPREPSRQLFGQDKSARFDGIPVDQHGSSALLIEGSAVSRESTNHDEYPAGHHDIVIRQVHASNIDSGIEPLVIHDSHFRNLRED